MHADPLIGISTGFTDYGDYLGLAFTRPLVRLGAIPVVVPYIEDAYARAALIDRLDGLLLGVGRDIAPERFDGERHPSSTAHSAHRDTSELTLARAALYDGLPLLGICRGMQIINVALGGSLHADHTVLPAPADAHPGGDWQRWQQVVAATLTATPAPAHPSHPISIDPTSRLAGALGAHTTVNSYHHQAIATLGQGLIPVAHADDGVIEAIELPTHHQLCLGVQWELQESWQDGPGMKVFELLVNAARTRTRAPATA